MAGERESTRQVGGPDNMMWPIPTVARLAWAAIWLVFLGYPDRRHHRHRILPGPCGHRVGLPGRLRRHVSLRDVDLPVTGTARRDRRALAPARSALRGGDHARARFPGTVERSAGVLRRCRRLDASLALPRPRPVRARHLHGRLRCAARLCLGGSGLHHLPHRRARFHDARVPPADRDGHRAPHRARRGRAPRDLGRAPAHLTRCS